MIDRGAPVHYLHRRACSGTRRQVTTTRPLKPFRSALALLHSLEVSPRSHTVTHTTPPLTHTARHADTRKPPVALATRGALGLLATHTHRSCRRVCTRTHTSLPSLAYALATRTLAAAAAHLAPLFARRRLSEQGAEEALLGLVRLGLKCPTWPCPTWPCPTWPCPTWPPRRNWPSHESAALEQRTPAHHAS